MGSEEATRTGETLDKRYRLDRYVCDDGSSDVYEGTDLKAQSAVVVRVPRPEFVFQRKEFESFVALPKSLLGETPPHVARVVAVASDDTGIPFVVEESTEGPTLADHLERHADGLPLAEASRLVAPLIEACARLHLSGVVHGRIEPARIQLVATENGTAPRIIHHRTRSGGDVVDVQYRAPELRDGSAANDPAADVWALAAVMHRAFTGHVPSSATGPSSALPANLVSVLRDALCDDPAERVSDAGVLWMRLEGPLSAAARAPTPQPSPVEQVPEATAATVVTKPKVGALARALAPLEPEAGALESVADPAATRAERKPPKRQQPLPPPPAAGAPPLVATQVQSRPRPSVAQRPEPARPPGGLSDAQLKHLMNLGDGREHAAWAWVRIVLLLLLLLLLLLYKVVPMVAEPELVTARRVFGARVKIVAVALMVTLVVAMARTWAVSAKAKALLMRPVVYSFQVVVVCVCILLGGALAYGQFDPAVVDVAAGGRAAGGAVWRGASGMARTVLPYAVTLLLLSAGAFGLMNGFKLMRQSMAIAIATLLLAAGGAAGATHLTVTTIKASLLQVRDEAEGKVAVDKDRLSVDRIKKTLGAKKIDVNNMPEPSADDSAPKTLERTSIGGGDDEKLLIEDMQRQRAHQQEVIKAAEKELPGDPIPR